VINEAETIAAVVRDVPRSIVDVVIVVDGGSTDMTAARARQAGALVLVESQSGYGAACLAGIRAAPPDCHIVAFIDGDGSDDPRDIPRLVSPIQSGAQDFVIGSRARTPRAGKHGDPPDLRRILRGPCHSSAPAMTNRQFENPQAGPGGSHLHFQVPAVRALPHVEPLERARGAVHRHGPAARHPARCGPAAPPRLRAASAAQSKRPGN